MTRAYVFDCHCMCDESDEARLMRDSNGRPKCRQHKARARAVLYECDVCGEWIAADPATVGRTKTCPACRSVKRRADACRREKHRKLCAMRTGVRLGKNGGGNSIRHDPADVERSKRGDIRP
jgi:hypothetical protein